MNTPTRRTRWIASLLVLAALALPQIAAAQAPEAEWAFNPMGVFADERVQLSMRLQMDTDAAADASGVTLDYLGAGELPPEEDAELLLAAAGVLPPEGSQITGIVVERPCRVWAANESLAPAAVALGEELSRVWSQYGVGFPPCGATDDPAGADILVFPFGQPPAEVDLFAARAQGSFLGIAEAPDGAPAGTGGNGGGTDAGPAPAQGGSGGDEASSDALAMTIGAVLALAALAGARGLTGIRPA